MSFFRFMAGEIGIYAAVEKHCPRSDPRRKLKPDAAWLPRVGEKFPGAISFWKPFGLEKYLTSGLQEWHRSVVKDPIFLLQQPKIAKPLYEDDYQVICLPEGISASATPWAKFVQEQSEYPLVEKSVAYIVRGQGASAELLVFAHDKEWSDAGIQVPAGTVDPGESPQSAALREAEEECGLHDLQILRKIDDYYMFRHTHRQFNRRYVFLMDTKTATPENWGHQVMGTGHDKDLLFHYYWMPLAEAAYTLAASLGCSANFV